MTDLPPGIPETALVASVVAGGVEFQPQYNQHDFEVEGYKSVGIEVVGLGLVAFAVEDDPGSSGRQQIGEAIALFRASANELLASARIAAFGYYEDVRDRTEPAPPVVSSAAEIWDHVEWWLDEVKVEIDYQQDTGAHVILQGSCAWEPEHGIELVFQAGQVLTRVGDRVGNPVPGEALPS